MRSLRTLTSPTQHSRIWLMVLPRLFGENSIDFEVLTTTITASGEVTEDDESCQDRYRNPR